MQAPGFGSTIWPAELPLAGKLELRRLNRGVPHPPSDSSAISFRSSCGAANEALGVRIVPLSLRWIDPPFAARSASIERDGGMAHGRPLRSLAGGCAHFL